MANLLSDAKKQQVIALGQLGWTLRRIEQATGVRRETASVYLKADEPLVLGSAEASGHGLVSAIARTVSAADERVNVFGWIRLPSLRRRRYGAASASARSRSPATLKMRVSAPAAPSRR
jgi:hypothetical protein